MEGDETWVAQGAGSGPGQTGPDDLDAGDRLGEYNVLGALGRGAMGQVYEVEHARLKRRYALKLLPASLAHDRGFSERFEREGATLASLEHPGIVQVHYAGEDAGRFYLVMERLQALFTNEDAGQCHPPEKVASILSQMLEALGYAHARNVIHRDLKPANLLATAEGRVKIADFGVARVVGEDFINTMVQETISKSRLGATATIADSGGTDLAGTLYYIAPEILNGGEADTRSDLYAVGVIGYELLTGKKPMGRYKDASKCVAGLNPRWDDFINRLLEPDPADRFANAADAVASLSALDAPATPPPPPSGASAPPPPPPAGVAASPVTPPPSEPAQPRVDATFMGDAFQPHMGAGGAGPATSGSSGSPPPPVATPPSLPPDPGPTPGPGGVADKPKRKGKRSKLPALLALLVLFAAGAGAAAYFGGEDLWTSIVGTGDRTQEDRDSDDADSDGEPPQDQFFPVEDQFFPQDENTTPAETNPALARHQAFTEQQQRQNPNVDPQTTEPVATGGLVTQQPTESTPQPRTTPEPEMVRLAEPEPEPVAVAVTPPEQTPAAQPIELVPEPVDNAGPAEVTVEPVATVTPAPNNNEALLGQDPGGGNFGPENPELQQMQTRVEASNQALIQRQQELLAQQQQMAELTEQIELETAQLNDLQRRVELIRQERQAALNDLAREEAQPPKELRRPVVGGGTRTVRVQENAQEIEFLKQHVEGLNANLQRTEAQLAQAQAQLAQSFNALTESMPETDTQAAPQGTDAETIRRINTAAASGDVASLERLAARDIPEAQTALANLFDEGRAVPRDYAQAARWYERAAEAGDPEAQYKLGWHYENGFGVPRDSTRAYELYQMAAESGNATAQYRIGASYVRGSGGQPRDYEQALYWFREAAASNHAEAQFSMGMLYESGMGVPTDPTLALAWYQRAADNGNARARRKVDAILSQQE